METWLPPLGFALLIGAAQLPLCAGQGIERSGPLSGLPSLVVIVVVVVIVVGAVGPGMMIGGTCLCPKCLLLQLFPHKRSGCLLLN